MLRILVSAYACEPGRGSEGEIGWSLVHELAKSHRVWVLTRANNKAVHDAAFAAEPKPATLNFIYYDTPRWARWYKKGKRFFLIYYYCWQLGSYWKAKRFLARETIDCVHHLTGGMDWMPSGLSLLGLPFLWGPVGSETIHPAILSTLPLKVRLKEILRKAIQFYGRELDPLVRLTGRRAKLILSHTPDNLPKRYHHKIIPYVQTGIHPTARFAQMKKSFGRSEWFTAIYAGELLHWKGAEYAVDAFLHFAASRNDVRLIVIGDGPLRQRLEEKVALADMTRLVSFMGKVPMDTLIAELSKGDLFLYPSYHHGLATVVLQAMLTGLPIVCLQGDAIGRTVGAECGVTVSPNEGEGVIQALSAALASLHDNEPLRVVLAKRAQELAITRYTFQTLGAGYQAVYQKLCTTTKAKDNL